jgi:hypothetical protein
MSPRNPIQMQFDVATADQAAELRAAWEEIVSGKRTRLETAAAGLDEIMERARTALLRIVKAIEGHPRSGQARRLISFLAGVYNGNDYPFDLTDLRALDTDLANACIDYLNYDRLAKAEVHTHLPGRGRQMHQFIAEQAVRPRLHLSSYEEHEQRLHALSERLDREPDALLKEALGDLLMRYEGKAFGARSGIERNNSEPTLRRYRSTVGRSRFRVSACDVPRLPLLSAPSRRRPGLVLPAAHES